MGKKQYELMFALVVVSALLGGILPTQFFTGHEALAKLDAYTPAEKRYSAKCRSWLGVNINQLIIEWGVPSRIISTSRGRIFMYKRLKECEGELLNCTTSFAADAEGTIRSFKWEGCACWEIGGGEKEKQP